MRLFPTCHWLGQGTTHSMSFFVTFDQEIFLICSLTWLNLVQQHKDYSQNHVNAFVCDITADSLAEMMNPSSVDILTMVILLLIYSTNFILKILICQRLETSNIKVDLCFVCSFTRKDAFGSAKHKMCFKCEWSFLVLEKRKSKFVSFWCTVQTGEGIIF